MLKKATNGPSGRKLHLRKFTRLLVVGVALAVTAAALYGRQTAKLTIHWDKVTVVLKSMPSLQVAVVPSLRPGEPRSAASYKALKELGADYLRYVPWQPYPRLAVAELEPPAPGKTSWDFNLIDPMRKDFLAATAGHPTVMNFSTTPEWMWKTDNPVSYPADPNQVASHYSQGTELRDPSAKELSDYYARPVSWYVIGGFSDEIGVRHESGYHYKFPVWEVFNEVDDEHKMTPEEYTAIYDAIVSAIHKVAPETKFMGLALANPRTEPQFFEYFLNPANHKPGIPLDYISYHFYAIPTATQTLADWQYTLFDQADGFLVAVRYIESIRRRLSPTTRTDLNDLGVMLPGDKIIRDSATPLPPAIYWNLESSVYAYLYIELSRLHIDIIGMSQLVGFPAGGIRGVSMMDWTTGKPNARCWVLKLINDSFYPGDQLAETSIDSKEVEAQAFTTSVGRKLLLVNKRDCAVEIALPDADNAAALTVDAETGEGPARAVTPSAGNIEARACY